MKDKLKKLKAKYSYVWEAKSPSYLLVATGVTSAGLAGYILLKNHNATRLVGEVAKELLTSGVKDFPQNDGSIVRVTLIK